MTDSLSPHPPRLAEWLVSAAAGPAVGPHVLGDLREEFAARLVTAGRSPATRWYWRQALGSVIPLLRARRGATPSGRGGNHMDSLKSDLSFALRALARRPAFASVAILTLALGLGAAATIFTIVDGVLLRPLPFPEGDRLVTLWQTDTTWRHQATLRDRWNRQWFNYPAYQQWSTAQRSLSSVALYGDQEMALTGAGDPAQVAVATATPNLLSVLGVRVSLGRWFLQNEVGTGTAKLAVISYELWRSRFGGDSAVIGRSLTLDDNGYRIVGVLPRDFALKSLNNPAHGTAAVWIPLGSDGGGQGFDSSYEAIGRLNRGVPLDAAAGEIDRLVRAASGRAERGARVLPRLDAETGGARRPLVLVSAGAGLLLLMACVNVALLLLGEVPSREHEIATRRALGASTARVVRQLLTESAVLATLGGLLGLAVAAVGVRLLIAAAPPGLPRLENVSIDGSIVLVCALAVLGTAFAFGLAPAVAASRASANESLRARPGQLGRRQRRLHDVAIALQVAMALLLLVGGAVLTRSMRNLDAVEIGIREHDVLTLSITAPAARYADANAVFQFYEALDERLRALPGVRAVGATSSLPFSGRNQTTSIEIENATTVVSDAKPNVQRRVVRPGYFEALGIPVRAGRIFDRDVAATSDEIVVDEAMANRLWPNETPLGKRIKVFGGWFTVAGVVGSVYHGRLDEPPRPTFYLPHRRQSTRQMSLVLRFDGDPLSHTDEVRRALWSVDPSIPITALSTMSSLVESSVANERFRTRLIDLFGAAAALLTGVGVFGVAARAVSQRRRELGIRMALGAAPTSIARAVVREQLFAVSIGLAAGLVGAVFTAPLLRDFAFGTSVTDPLTILFAVLCLAATSIAAVLPAVRSAVRIAPASVIRDA